MHAEVHLDRIRPGRRRAAKRRHERSAKRRHDRHQLKAWLDRPIERRNAGLIFGAGVLGGSLLSRGRHASHDGAHAQDSSAGGEEQSAKGASPSGTGPGAGTETEADQPAPASSSAK